jgi:hypothetical protein
MFAFINRFPYFRGAKVMVKDIPRTIKDWISFITLLTKTYKMKQKPA